MRRLVLPAAVVAVTAALSVTAAIGFGSRTPTDDGTRTGGMTTAAVAAARGGDLAQVVAGLQEHLRSQPRDVRSWATLGVAYVEQSRVTGDPTYYPKAEDALQRSVALSPRDNAPAEAGLAVLAAARHDFSSALQHADAALLVNPYDAQALAARVDALTELGRYDTALEAAEHADEVRPGLTTFTRLSYQAELRGQAGRARQLLERARQSARTPADVAFVEFHLGELARGDGRLPAAQEHYAAALTADPRHVPAVAGQARIAATLGRTEDAVRRWRDVVTRLPLPEHLTAYGELLESLGRDGEARQQYDVVRAAARLAEANGVATDLELALFEADHGFPAAAVAAAQQEWSRRHSVHVADALGWALHRAGRDREALGFARQATRLGLRDPAFLFHRGMIERALGRDADAAKHLQAALAIDPEFSPLHATAARRALAAMESAR